MTDKPYLKKGATEINLGRIKREQTTLDSGATPILIPLSDSDETKAYDFLGKLKKITITGQIIGALADVVTAITTLDSMIDAGQNDEIDQVTYFGPTGTVYEAGQDIVLKSITYTFEEGMVTQCTYTIEMFVATLILAWADEEPEESDIGG